MAPNGRMTKEQLQKALRAEFAPTSWSDTKTKRFVIDCPSGQRCLAKVLTTLDLVSADLIEDLDTFTKRLVPSEFDAEGNPVTSESSSIWALLRDPDNRAKFLRLLNRLLSIALVAPRVIDDGVTVITKPSGEKTVTLGGNGAVAGEGEVLASDIDLGDKMAIFAELNKPLGAITPFRPEQIVSLSNMGSSQSVGSTA